jgi:alpha-L-fucosidase
VPLTAQGFTEGKGRAFTAEDIRFTARGSTVYVIVLGVPQRELSIAALGTGSGLAPGRIRSVSLLGSAETVEWDPAPRGLVIQPPRRPPSDIAVAWKVERDG